MLSKLLTWFGKGSSHEPVWVLSTDEKEKYQSDNSAIFTLRRIDSKETLKVNIYNNQKGQNPSVVKYDGGDTITLVNPKFYKVPESLATINHNWRAFKDVFNLLSLNDQIIIQEAVYRIKLETVLLDFNKRKHRYDYIEQYYQLPINRYLPGEIVNNLAVKKFHVAKKDNHVIVYLKDHFPARVEISIVNYTISFMMPITAHLAAVNNYNEVYKRSLSCSMLRSGEWISCGEKLFPEKHKTLILKEIKTLLDS